MKYESADGATIITCAYDYMGRRFEKKVSVNGAVTLHERYLYRDYRQIAAPFTYLFRLFISDYYKANAYIKYVYTENRNITKESLTSNLIIKDGVVTGIKKVHIVAEPVPVDAKEIMQLFNVTYK